MDQTHRLNGQASARFSALGGLKPIADAELGLEAEAGAAGG